MFMIGETEARDPGNQELSKTTATIFYKPEMALRESLLIK